MMNRYNRLVSQIVLTWPPVSCKIGDVLCENTFEEETSKLSIKQHKIFLEEWDFDGLDV